MFILGWIYCSAAWAQYETKSVQAARTAVEPHLDGFLNDSCWALASPATGFIINDPTPGVSLPFATEVRLIYTDEALYIGFMNHDPEPSEVLQQLSGRDQIGNADYCGIALSTYRDGINGFKFTVTPNGEQSDSRLDALNGDDVSWNAVWQCKTHHGAEGWSAEFKIPFAAIRFMNKDEHVWDVNFIRQVRRHRQIAYWNGVNPLVTGFLTQMGVLNGIRNIAPPRRIFLFPYASAYQNYSEQAAGGNVKSSSYNAGMDLKLGLSDAFTLDATLVPDFGQVISDQLILNVSPFEVQFQDFRQFFTEGTELFNKAGLFYSRRVGGEPIGYFQVSRQLTEGETIVSNPANAQLLNATKISGRNSSGLGLGFFNAMTNKMNAIVRDSLGNTREIETSPLTNYNIVVADQNLKHNSFFTLINTNVTRSGSWTDANVLGTQFDLRNARNSYAVRGNGAFNAKYGRNAQNLGAFKNGYKANVLLSKISGNYTSDVGVNIMSDTYDPNDLGFNTFNNFINYIWSNSYRIYKPFWKLNSLWSTCNFTYTQLYNPNVYTNFNISANVGVTNKKFHTANLMFDLTPINGYDYFEARSAGQKFLVYSNNMIGGWISTDYRRPVAWDVGAWYTQWQPDGRYQFNWRVAPRLRLNDHWFVTYVYSFQSHRNDLGWAGRDGTRNSVFGQRDVVAHTNVLNIAWSATPWMTTTCRVRHYWGYSRYHRLLDIDNDGRLIDPTNGGFYDSGNSLIAPSAMNRNFNSFTIDLIYRWIFIPGSEVSVVWKNSIIFENRDVPDGLREDLDFTFRQPGNNNFSIKVLYFLDYHQLKDAARAVKSALG